MVVGTTAEIAFPVTNVRGEPVVPSSCSAWAVHADSGEVLDLEPRVVDGELVGEFSPTRAGEWRVAVRVDAPVRVSERVSLRVDALPADAPPPTDPRI